jgi:hypothetical protein
MRAIALLATIAPLAAACASDPAGPALSDELITIDTPSFTLQPGEEKFYCYYTTLPTATTGIHRMSSLMPPGSHHMIVFKTQSAHQPDGTFGECSNFGAGGGGVANVPVWLYATQTPEGEFTLPDGVGIAVGDAQPVIVNIHYINQTEAPLTANVHLEFESFVPNAKFIEAHAFVTYNSQISLPPGATGGVSGSCNVPADAQFVSMTTHSHKYTTSAVVMDGGTMVLETLDWAHATVERWDKPYYTFGSGTLDYSCEYHNTTDRTLETGESAIANEMCMAVGVFFPSSSDIFCLDSLTLTL